LRARFAIRAYDFMEQHSRQHWYHAMQRTKRATQMVRGKFSLQAQWVGKIINFSKSLPVMRSFRSTYC